MPEQTRLGIGPGTPPDGDPATDETVGTGPTLGLGPGERPASPRAIAAEAEAFRGTTIGRFVLLSVLGSGGMGHVYAAYDPHLDRKVAIKLLHAAAIRGGTDDARTRLLREAQAMAKIDHPNVVRVHEVGTVDDQVYVAMEFVDGGTLRAWLAGEHTLPELLAVLGQAGRGLAAAHAAGLVHRDFKPDNVLLAGDGSVRVTDFGLVGVTTTPGTGLPPDAPPSPALDRVASQDLGISGNTPLSQSLTRTGAIMGTPAYMAPEQLTGAVATARTDQFAFCVVLHEALYGVRPFAGANLQELGANVLAGQISPPPPGARVPGWLRRVALRGLSVDPAARHPSMDALLSELARDPARRRRRILAWTAGLGVPAAAALAIALRPGEGAVCDTGGDRVAEVWSSARRAQMKAAFLASGRPHAAASFDKLTGMLDAWGRSWEDGYRDACRATRVRLEQSEHLLDLRMQCLTRRLAEADATIALLAAGGGDAVDHALEAAMALPPLAPCADAAGLTAAVAPPETELVRAQVQAVRGRLDEARGLERLGRYGAALAAARHALAAARATGYRPVTAEALLVVGRLQIALADRAGIETLRESMHAAVASGDDAGTIDAAGWLVQAIAAQGGRYEIAHELAELAEATASRARPAAEIDVRLQNSIGLLEETRGKPAVARPRYEKALAIAEKELGPDHLDTLATLTLLGNLARTEGRFADARKLLERALASREQMFGKDHPDVASALNNLGAVARSEAKLDDAQRLFERALAIRTAALGPDHPEVGASYNELGKIQAERGDQAAAGSYYARALALWEKAYGANDVRIASAAMNLALTLDARNEHEQAVELLRRVIALYEAAYGPEHPELGRTLMNLGTARLRQGKLDEALSLYQRAERIAEKVYGPEHPAVADALTNMATILRAQNKPDETRAMILRSLRIVEQVYGPDHPRLALGLANLGTLQAVQGDHPGAIESFRRSIAIFEAKLGKSHIHLAYPLRGLGYSLLELQRGSEAVPHLERALQIRIAGKAKPQLLGEIHALLAYALIQDPRSRARAFAEARAAIAWYEKAGNTGDLAEMRSWMAEQR